jgi:hypothetical protein
MSRRGRLIFFSLAVAASPVPAWSHPLGNFSIDHYARLRVAADSLRLRFIIDMAEIPAIEALLQADTDGDRDLSPAERHAYLERTAAELLARLEVTCNGAPLDLRIEYKNLTAPSHVGPAGTGSAPATLRFFIEIGAALPAPLPTRSVVRYLDANFAQRVGWKETVVVADDDVRLVRSSAPSQDLSNELTRYPPSLAPPQDVSAEFTFEIGPANGLDRVGLGPSSLWALAAAGLFVGLMALRYLGMRRAT